MHIFNFIVLKKKELSIINKINHIRVMSQFTITAYSGWG